MPFKHACFISYRDRESLIGKRMIESLYNAIFGEIDLYGLKIGAYLDKKRLTAGYFYNEALASALCESLFMILVFTTDYFDPLNTYCAREYKAMLKLEKKRLQLLPDGELRDKGLIVPIVIRGVNHVPEEIKGRRLYHDFSNHTLGEPEISANPTYAPVIRDLIVSMDETYRAFASLPHTPNDCEDFKLPSDKEIEEWLMRIAPPHNPDFP